MEAELLSLDEQMKNEIKGCKDKYSLLKKQVREKYKNNEKEKKKLEKEELKKLRKSIPKTLRIKVWDTTIGKEKGVGDCFVCNTNIDSKNFECGHIISVKEGGETTLENLKPICGCCNKSMGIQNLIEFKDKYFPQIKENKPDIPNNPDSKVVEFIKNNITSCSDFNSFLSLDDIHAKYFKWLSFKYEDYYSSVKFSGCFGEPSGLSELKKELSLNYIDNTDESVIHKYYSLEAIDDYYDMRLSKILNEYLETRIFKDNNARLCYKKQLKRMIKSKSTQTPKFEAFNMWRISRINYYISKQKNYLLQNNNNIDDFIMKKGYGFMNIKYI